LLLSASLFVLFNVSFYNKKQRLIIHIGKHYLLYSTVKINNHNKYLDVIVIKQSISWRLTATLSWAWAFIDRPRFSFSPITYAVVSGGYWRRLRQHSIMITCLNGFFFVTIGHKQTNFSPTLTTV
jgi:hypothetical protein